MKNFTEADVLRETISVNYPDDLVLAQLDWQKRGLQETASGYGSKLTGSYKISFNGKLHRIYHTCYSNSSSPWFKTKGRTIYVH